MMSEREFFWNKGLSIALPLLLIVMTIPYFSTPENHWRFLLLATVILGYTHYLIGGFYQVKGLFKKENSRAQVVSFVLLTLIATGLWYICLVTDSMVLLAFVAIPYFMIHGFLNEQTFLERTFTTKVPFGVVGSLSVWLTAVTTLSFIHPSAFFDENYQYRFQTVESFFQFPIQIPDWLFLAAQYLGMLGLLVAFGWILLTIYWYRKWTLTIPVLLVCTLGTVAFFVLGTFNYVYLFTMLLCFHFLTWMFFYGVRFSEPSKRALGWYVWWHLAIVGALLLSLLVFLDVSEANPLYFMATNNYLFLLLTTIHITTSFLNEKWFQSLL